MQRILLVYKRPELLLDENGELFIPAREQDLHTVSYGEEPGIQAIATMSPGLLPTMEDGTLKRDHGYKRSRTVSLLAAINLLSGEAIPLIRDTHTSEDFIDFPKILNEIKIPRKIPFKCCAASEPQQNRDSSIGSTSILMK